MDSSSEQPQLKEYTDYLKKLEINSYGGTSVYDHLVNTLTHILEQRPSNPLDMATQFSSYTHNSKLVADPIPNDFYPEPHFKAFTGIDIKASFDDDIIPPPVKVVKEKKIGEDGEEIVEDEPEADEEDEEGAETGSLPNVPLESSWLSSVGAGMMTEEEWHLLTISIKTKILGKFPLKSARIFGKFLGLKSDYYVCEGEYADPEARPSDADVKPTEGDGDADGDADADADGEGEGDAEDTKIKEEVKKFEIPPEVNIGSNRFSYWVCTKPHKDWTALPNCKPEHIIMARKIKKYFTGDLEAPINCYPEYPGLEKHYLRAQIARISSATTIAPKGLFSMAEEEEEEAEEDADGNPIIKEKSIFRDAYLAVPELAAVEAGDGEEDEEPEEGEAPKEQPPKTAQDFLNPNNWLHIVPTLLACHGRITLFKPEGDEDGEGGEDGEEDGEAKVEKPQVEQILPLLSSIELEEFLGKKCNGENYKAWKIECSDSVYSSSASAVVLARSLRWPGAVSIVKGSSDKVPQYCNMYVGYGHKYEIGTTYASGFGENTRSEYEKDALVGKVDPTPKELETYKPPPPPPEPEVAEGEGEGEDKGEGEGEGEDKKEEEATE